VTCRRHTRMDLKSALAAIKKLDNGADLASAIESEIEKLQQKNYEVIGEKRTATGKAQSLEAALTAIAKTLGVEGELDTVLSTLDGKVREVHDGYKTVQTKVGELETRATTAEGKVQGLERQTKLTEIAAKAGAEYAVLEKLLGDKVEELTIADNEVKLGDKPLKEYVETDATLKPFLPALFPGETAGKKSEVKLPSGSPNGGQTTSDPAKRYVGKAYTGWKRFTAS
jgi:chromosome segregation ATPase